VALHGELARFDDNVLDTGVVLCLARNLALNSSSQMWINNDNTNTYTLKPGSHVSSSCYHMESVLLFL